MISSVRIAAQCRLVPPGITHRISNPLATCPYRPLFPERGNPANPRQMRASASTGEVCGWCRCRSSNSSMAVSRQFVERHHVPSCSRIAKSSFVWSHGGSANRGEFVCKLWARITGGARVNLRARDKSGTSNSEDAHYFQSHAAGGPSALGASFERRQSPRGYYTRRLKRPVLRPMVQRRFTISRDSNQ